MSIRETTDEAARINQEAVGGHGTDARWHREWVEDEDGTGGHVMVLRDLDGNLLMAMNIEAWERLREPAK